MTIFNSQYAHNLLKIWHIPVTQENTEQLLMLMI
jgi:hypothetical protein